MDKVIIDTSAWIASFRPKGDQKFSLLVKDLILRNRVLMPGIIKTELLRGTRSKREFNRLSDLLKGITYLPVAEEFWQNLSEFSFQIFRKGANVPLTDTHIVLLCIENNAHLLHRSKHFDLIAKKSLLKILK